MKNVSTIGIDLAKNTMQVHGVDDHGKVVLQRSIHRGSVAKFFANLPHCKVGVEACATSAHWARVIESCGHTVGRMHASFVTPYRMAGKNDANDAAAICEAVSRPHMRFVPHKSQDQADIQAIHRVRQSLVKTRTATINQARGLLAENGLVIPQGACHVRRELPAIMGDMQNSLSGVMRDLLAKLYGHIAHLDEMVAEQEKMLKTIAKEREVCTRLQKVPGIGYLTATALLTVTGRPADFRNGREFAAYLGLVPRQHSTGGKSRMFGITKRGDRTVRTLLIHGARAVLRSVKMGYAPLGDGSMAAWLQGLLDRRGYNRACVALANKMARITWTMLAKGTEYRMA